MSLRLPRCRKFPRRISQEELKSRTTQEVNDKGGNTHFQAQFYSATAKEVVGSADPLFFTLQPVLREHDEEAWAQAYEFVYAFLKKHKMTITRDTVKTEFAGGSEPPLVGTFDNYDMEEFADALLEMSQTLNETSLKDRVESFAVDALSA